MELTAKVENLNFPIARNANGTGNRYFVNGKLVPVSIANLRKKDASLIIQQLNEYKSGNSYESFNKYISIWIESVRLKVN